MAGEALLGDGAPDIPYDRRGVLARREQPAPVGGEAGGDDRAVVAPERQPDPTGRQVDEAH